MERKILHYQGQDIVVHYERPRCIHAEECVHGLPEVFDSTRKPWIDADATATERVAEVVRRCPTGALHYERRDNGPAEVTPGDKLSWKVMRPTPASRCAAAAPRNTNRSATAAMSTLHSRTRARPGPAASTPRCPGAGSPSKPPPTDR